MSKTIGDLIKRLQLSDTITTISILPLANGAPDILSSFIAA